jgi:hypothetical protein
MGRPLKIAKAFANITITATAVTNIVTTSSNLSTLNITKGMSFVLDATLGNLIAATKYYILEILSNSTFTASTTPLDQNVDRIEMALTATSVASNATVNPTLFPLSNVVTGGKLGVFGNKIKVNAAFEVKGTGTISCSTASVTLTGTGTSFLTQLGSRVYTNNVLLGYVVAITNNTTATLGSLPTINLTNSEFTTTSTETGTILAQKGKTKFRAIGDVSGTIGTCATSNLPIANLEPNTLRIEATYANAVTASARTVNGKTAQLFTSTPGVFDSVYATFGTPINSNPSNGLLFPTVRITKA